MHAMRTIARMLAVAAAGCTAAWAGAASTPPRPRTADNVCPSFKLLDEDGRIIDPMKGLNADKPYSPKHTCGKCHDYDKITRAYHFMQGKGEKPTPDQAARCQWVSTPGNYGGTWCSPAPLYVYLSPKKNPSPAAMDMTSFTFITIGCGACHPGGGSAEYDRDGRRYDRWMADPASGFTPGGDNDFDGDYYKARWSQTGVLEADCLICHLPEYNMAERRRQIKALNFRWAATAGAGLATVAGSVAKGEPVTVEYDKARFNPDGTLSPHIVREPRNEACLACHAKPGWKKRGANFRARTDVHLRAGLRCVDCHPAGQSATDPRIRGKELHEIAKGDDPGGHVRDDLDNTGRTCADCHATGFLGAPVAKHTWLPPLHLDRIACQTCHVPQRAVKAARFVASDVFNPGTKIPTKGKHLWTFYGPDMKYWNHYGELEMMGYDDKPSDPFRPFLVRYKGKIYPANRVHTTWPGIETQGKPGLAQPRMRDIYAMWVAHQKAPSKYPQLSKITDDNGDGVLEVNRPEEIDALIAAVAQRLNDVGYPLDGKRVVWVCDERIYESGTRFHTIPKHLWEASPYGNVHTYNHDVYPADAALGANGCTDCHSPSSPVFFAPVAARPVDPETGAATPATEPQYRVLGIAGFWANVGAWREAALKPLVYALLVALGCALVALAGQWLLAWGLGGGPAARSLRPVPWLAAIAAAIAAVALSRQPGLLAYMLPTRFWLDANHFAVAAGVLVVGVVALLAELRAGRAAAASGKRGALGRVVAAELGVSLVVAVVCGLLMLLKLGGLGALTRAAFTAFDLSLALVLVGAVTVVLRRAAGPAATPAGHAGTLAP